MLVLYLMLQVKKIYLLFTARWSYIPRISDQKKTVKTVILSDVLLDYTIQNLSDFG